MEGEVPAVGPDETDAARQEQQPVPKGRAAYRCR